MRRRWKFDSYELRYNPKSLEEGMRMSGEISTGVNGLVTSSNLYFEKETQFVFDIYDSPSKYLPSFNSFANGNYVSIAQKGVSGNVYALRASGNYYDTIDVNTGDLLQSRYLGSSGNAVAMTSVDNGVAVVFDNGTLVKYDENNTQISKYTYNDIDVKNTVSLSYDSISGFYLMSKFGKIIKVDNQGNASLIYQFNDYDSNSANNKAVYRSIYYYHNGYSGYLGVLSDNEIVYYDEYLNEAYKLDTNRYIRDISYSIFTGRHFVITNSTMHEAHMNLSGLEIEKVKGLIGDGAVILTDEHNITKAMVVESMQVKRLRNLQESRYEISISGKIM